MILRTWTTGIDESRADEYEEFALARSLPMFRDQPGFVDVTLARTAGSRLVITRWRDAASVDALAASTSYRETVAAIEAAGFLRPPQTVAVWEARDTGGGPVAAPDAAATVAGVIEFPLHTARLTLSPLGTPDRDAFLAYRRDPEIARWQSWTPDYSADDADRLLAAQPATLAPRSGQWLQVGVRTADGDLIGDVAIHALADQPDTFEIGVTLASAVQGRGYAREAVGGVVDALFRGGAHRLLAHTDARNTASARVFAALGFRHEARHVDADWFKGEWTTLDVWALLRTDPVERTAVGGPA